MAQGAARHAAGTRSRIPDLTKKVDEAMEPNSRAVGLWGGDEDHFGLHNTDRLEVGSAGGEPVDTHHVIGALGQIEPGEHAS